MGQQQMVAEKEAGGALRRIVVALTIAALMVAMMALEADPATAKTNPGHTTGKPDRNFGDAPNSADVFHCPKGAAVFTHGSGLQDDSCRVS